MMHNNAPRNNWSQRFSFSRHFRNSTASALTFGTINTALPEYNITDPSIDLPPDFDEPSASGIPSPAAASQSIASSSQLTLDEADDLVTVLPRYSYINPRYSTILSFPAHEHDRGDANSTKDRRFEFTFPIRANKPWCTLQIFTQSSIPGNPDIFPQRPKIPRLWGGQAITGIVSFDIQNPQTIQQIKIRLKGKIVTSSLEGGSRVFLAHDVLVWSKNSATTSAGEFNGKLIGKHNFPFSFPFPTYVNASSMDPVIPPAPETISPFSLDSEWSSDMGLPSTIDESGGVKVTPRKANSSASSFSTEKGITSTQAEQKLFGRNDNLANGLEACPTPQTFLESLTMANIQYELSVHLDHGRFRKDSKIKTNLGYIPSIVPRPASVMRRAAYEAGALIPGPVADPEGWFALPKAVILGELGGVGGKEVRIGCMLHLANPLSYTRGSTIPCYLDLSSEDSKALGVLCTPKMPYVRLVRRIQYFNYETSLGNDADSPLENRLVDGSFGLAMNTILALPSGNSGIGGELRTDLHEVGVGQWWFPPKDVVQEPNLRHLEGEIHLDLELQPSCTSTIFSVEYFVEMLPCNSTLFDMIQVESGIKGIGTREGAFISHPVEVATLFAQDAPIPVPFSKPPKKRIMVSLQEGP